MRFTAEASRDSVVAGVAWLAAVWMAVTLWSFSAQPLDTGTLAVNLLTAAHLVLLLIGLPLLLLHAAIVHTPHRLDKQLPIILGWAAGFLMAELALVQFLLATRAAEFKPSSVQTGLNMLTVVILLTLGAALYWKRHPIDFRSLFVVGAWALLLIDARHLITLGASADVVGMREILAGSANNIYNHSAIFLPLITVTDRTAQIQTLVTILVGIVAFASLAILPLAFVRRRIRERAYAFVCARPAVHATYWGAAAVLALVCSRLLDAPLVLWGSLLLASAAGVVLSYGSSPSLTPAPDELHSRLFRSGVIVVIGLYIVLAVIGTLHSERLLNQDALSYLHIARQYAEGNPVVRGYWSPLISWLMAPLFALGLDIQLAQHLFATLVGLGWIGVTLLLSRRFGLRREFVLLGAVIMALAAFQHNFTGLNPDPLSAVILGLYFYVVSSPVFIQRPGVTGVFAGVLGGLAYVAKYYNLPFVLAHLVLTGLLLILQGGSWKRAVRASAVALTTTLIVVSPWLVALHNRYDHWTISTTGAIARAYMAPLAESEQGHPCLTFRLCDHPDDVLFPWEDPLLDDYPGKDWGLFEDVASIQSQITVSNTNIVVWLQESLIGLGGPLLPLTLVALGVFIVANWKDRQRRFLLGWVLLTSLLYTAGYMTTFARTTRYYLPYLPLLVLSLLLLLQTLLRPLPAFTGSRHRFVQRLSTWAAATALAVSFVNPAQLAAQLNQPLTARRDCLRIAAEHFTDVLEAPMAGSHQGVTYFSFYTGTRAYGTIGPGFGADAIAREMRAYGVRTFVLERNVALVDELVNRHDFTLVDEGRFCQRRFLILRPPGT